MINLYPDQIELLDATRSAFVRTKNVLMRANTGFGKTIVSAAIMRGAVDKGRSCMMVVPRRELLSQVSNTLTKYNIWHSFISAGHPYNPYALVHVATTDTLARRLDTAIDKNLVIYDECHFGKGALGRVIEEYKRRGSYSLGLTATPSRMDGRGLGCWFDEMVNGKSLRWLIDNGRLSDYRLFSPDQPDLSALKSLDNKGQLADFMAHDRVLVGNAIEHYKSHAMGRLNMTFCVSVEVAERTTEKFNQAGIPTASVDGRMSDDERKRIFRAYARRELLNICSVDLCLFGFDLSAAAGMDVTIETMSDLRPTQSMALQRQKWGRVLRMKPDAAVIFDHVGNVRRHSLPDDEPEWTLDSTKKKARDTGEIVIPVRNCPRCFFNHRPAPVCPDCGFVYPIQARELKEVEGELKELSKEEFQRQREKEIKSRKAEQGAARTIPELIALGKKRGMKNPSGWAMQIMRARAG